MKKQNKNKKISSWLYWTPRILSILFVLFLILFSLDIFDMNLGFWGTILGLFMHNLPALILLIVLLISWKHELVGGIAFILAGILYIFSAFIKVPWYLALSWSLIISGPAFIIGILWVLNWKKKK